MSLPARLVAEYVLTIGTLWLLTTIAPAYLSIGGSWVAMPVAAALLLLLNLFARPILKILTFPLKLFMTIVAVILANGLFLWILETIADRFDPSIATFTIHGGWIGWILVALVLGLANWIIQHIVR